MKRFIDTLCILLLLASTSAGAQTWTNVLTEGAGSIVAMPNDAIVAHSGTTTYRSTDHGATWTAGGTIAGDVVTIRSDAGGTLYAGTWFRDGLYRSTNGGASWAQVPIEDIYTIWDIATHGDNIYLATEGEYIIRSTDRGATWQSLSSNGLGSYVWATAVDAQGNVFAGIQGGGILRSTDNGNTWTQSQEFSDAIIQGIAIDGEGRLFAGTYDLGVLRSTDGGITWQQTSLQNQTGWTNSAVNRTIAIDNAGHIYVSMNGQSGGTNMRSIFRSTDHGETWTDIGAGLSGAGFVGALAVDSEGRLFAAAQLGIYMLSEAAAVTDARTDDRAVSRLRVHSTANDLVELELSIPARGRVWLEVVNIAGERVCELMAEDLEAGEHTVRWEVGDMPRGIYLCRLEYSGRVETRRVSIVR